MYRSEGMYLRLRSKSFCFTLTLRPVFDKIKNNCIQCNCAFVKEYRAVIFRRYTGKDMSLMEDKYAGLKLGNQICFPLYACSREIVKKYKPYLDELDLTYTQYITMMVLWERGQINVKELGECLYLDSGTLTPLLKKLETKGWVTRQRAKEDERVLIVTLTQKGQELLDLAAEVPKKMSCCVKLSPEEAKTLYTLLYKMLGDSCG